MFSLHKKKASAVTPGFIGFLQGIAVILSVWGLNWLMSTITGLDISDPTVIMVLFVFFFLWVLGLTAAWPVALLAQKRVAEAAIVFGVTLATMGAFVAAWIIYLVKSMPFFV
jgi:hypothetical protein